MNSTPDNEANALAPEREPRINPVPDPAGESVLADSAAEELAYEALLTIAHHEEWIGEHAGYLIDDKRVLTHTWTCERPGYRGWYWTATVTRAPRSKKVTVDEVSLLPGEDALLSPKWIPWDVRLEAAEEEIKERRAAQAEHARREKQAAKEAAKAAEVAEERRSSRSGRTGRKRGASGHSSEARTLRKRSAARALRASRGPVVRGSRRRTYDA